MPRQIQKIKQTQKIIQTRQEHTRAQTQKNYTNPEIKHTKKKNHKRILYKTKSIHIYIYILKPNYPKEKIDLNLKIKSIQSLTKYPQN